MNFSLFGRVAVAIAICISFAVSPTWAERKLQFSPDKYISASQVADSLIKGEERVFLLDVRNDWEYSDFHIPGASNIAVQVLKDPNNLAKIPKGRKIVLYCRTGVRSERALGILLAKGYDAYSMEGGVASWWRNIIEPPSITMAPFGKQGAPFRKRQGIRNYFMKIPGAGPALATPPGPDIKKSAKSAPQVTDAPKVAKPKMAPLQPCAVGGTPDMGNPCG
ncbi:MAG: rhodanese-like domain-containing protein [Nitrospinaceae bacterium]|jgi:rhodanese-related sulfurtransferase|nr:rhodanese-like domain-containing protein [Nitrospinaceae bacterium]MBT3435700.1 rhodanese-like domain-containing protein [Nitrospinaceae bacterium]MBT3820597.1 rhodanese-like domain-containing protein [Nitrospinaceae bacterium]MBT4092611.1 rhodanese-like domain-containing protein [Nitrospinaceae bacterium]MBT4430341.1 rhodanese-like domain-containing protein [Nitrospinaceae bacterium]